MMFITMAVTYGAAFAVQVLTKPVFGIALVLFYYDQRIRQEGFDIEWMMQQVGLEAPAAQQSEGQPWLPPIPDGGRAVEAGSVAATAAESSAPSSGESL
jgi:hypothetical protein